MAEVKYNLDRIVSKYIHRPIIKNNDNLPPLYARTGSESETTFDSEGLKNPIWLSAVEKRYNSPTNVRRLFIGDKKVTIQYYQPPYSAGSTSSNYWATYSIDSDEQLDVIAQKLITYKKNGGADTERVSVTKTGLGALSNHWTMSNVEEIFITPNILVSEDILRVLPDSTRLLQIAVTNNTGKGIKSDIPLRIFESANGSNIKNIRTRFPRLKTVALMTNLDILMDVAGTKNLRDGLPTEVNDFGIRWVLKLKELGVLRNTTFFYSEVPFEQGYPLDSFSVRPGIYKYDATILQPYVEKYKSKYLELRRKARDEKLGKKEEERVETKSEYEKYLDSIMTTHGESIVKAAIQLTFARIPKEEIDKTFNEMSSDGKQKYRQMLGK